MPRLAHFRQQISPLYLDTTLILHVDMDAFFVSRRVARSSELRESPFVVMDSQIAEESYLAASYEARQRHPFGQCRCVPPESLTRTRFSSKCHDLYAGMER